MDSAAIHARRGAGDPRQKKIQQELNNEVLDFATSSRGILTQNQNNSRPKKKEAPFGLQISCLKLYLMQEF